MKKFIVIIIAFLWCAANASGGPYTTFKPYMYFCDACGCSASGGGMGFSSMIDQNFAGLRYFHQSYSSRDGVFNDSPWIDENFNTLQAWARVPLGNKVQVSVQIPYHFHNRELSSGRQEINGLGDVTILGLYTLAQTVKDFASYTHTLQIGGGIKIPVGKYNSDNNGSVNPSFQLGTGSWDYLLASEYVVRKESFGLNAMLNYVIKTTNDKEYRFGNQLNYGATLFYVLEKSQFTIVPQAGIAGEVYDANKQFGEVLPDTAGQTLFGKAGLEAGIGKFSVGVNGMLPISQKLTGGKVEANYRWSVNLNYSL